MLQYDIYTYPFFHDNMKLNCYVSVVCPIPNINIYWKRFTRPVKILPRTNISGVLPYYYLYVNYRYIQNALVFTCTDVSWKKSQHLISIITCMGINISISYSFWHQIGLNAFFFLIRTLPMVLLHWNFVSSIYIYMYTGMYLMLLVFKRCFF